jgi:hypothetical protein
VKRAKLRRLVEDVLEMRAALPARPVTFRILSIDFESRTVTLDGRIVPVSARALDIPILTGDVAFMPSKGWERLA